MPRRTFASAAGASASDLSSELNDDDEDLSHNQFPLDDDFNVENLLGRELGGIDDDIDINNADLR